MYTLACPQPSVRPSFSQNQSPSRIQCSLIFVLALALGTTACSTLNAGSSTHSLAIQPIAISASLPLATVGSAYSAVITVRGGTAPYTFAIRAGQLPTGLSLNATRGTISGTPKVLGSYNFTISVADKSNAAEGVKGFLMAVMRPVVSPTVSVEVSPISATLAPGASRQFMALVSNATTPAVTWTASAGTVTATGLFTAPKVSASTTIQLTAASKADPTKTASAAVTVETPSKPAPDNLALNTTSLPDATEGSPYSAALHASGGQTPYQWKAVSGSLPSGLAFQTSAGVIQGITSQSGAFSFTASVTDAAGQTVSHKFALNVSLSSSGNFDGPAELPRVYVSSALADTPARGTVHLVNSAAALQSTLDSAQCGDTISLAAGSTVTGTFVFPAKDCDDNHWIVVRTGAPDRALPPEGTRLTPCYAGVASLPARPAFDCPSPKNVLAKILYDGTGSGPIVLANGANHYRLLGLEITRSQSKAVVYNLVVPEKDGATDHIIFDRMWLHGTAQDETTRAIMLSGATNVAVVDSYMSDFHCVAVSGACGDSQAIGGGLGNRPMGPYRITNNFMEAAGETIIFGGGPATLVPADIEVRGNHMFKPRTWMKGSPNFVGGHDGHPFIVKNLFELKNAQRVLLAGNILEGAWGGFSQVGFAILLTPKNQASADGTSVCPACLVTDVTVRYNLVRHTASGMQIGNGISSTGGAPRDGQRYSIHDVIFEDIDSQTYNGTGVLAQVSTGPGAPVLQNIKIDHVTAISLRTVLVIGDQKSNPKMNNFSFTNSITNAGPYPFISGPGGSQDCTYRVTALAMLNACFANFQFNHNAVIALPKSTPESVWPTGNYFPSTPANVRFVNDAKDKADYTLLPTSPYRNAGTDGRDLGADVAAVAAATASAN